MMSLYEQILAKIQADERYQRNIQWGQPRPGHPEGAIRQHIQELEENLEQLRPRLSGDEAWKLRVLIHTHDSFKPEAQQDVAISHPRSHASLACQFLQEFTSDNELLAMVQLHDEPYALWHKQKAGRNYDQRLDALINKISDWDLFLAFLIVDGCTAGKSREPLTWFFSRIDDRVSSRVTTEWLIAASENNEAG
jgi:hypothetical protein